VAPAPVADRQYESLLRPLEELRIEAGQTERAQLLLATQRREASHVVQRAGLFDDSVVEERHAHLE